MSDWAAINTQLLPALNAFAGASLGASFYVLVRTQPFLVSRSYDPKYNAVYVARFITGVIAGVILAIAIRPVLDPALSGAGGTLGPGVLAILGGYATEAVEQILQRLVEVLLTAVRGDGSGQVEARLAKEQAEKSAKVGDIALEIERAPDDATRSAALQRLRDALRSSKD